MKIRVLLRRAAELDLVAIEDWYDAQQEGLGAAFRETVDDAFRRIGDNPLSYMGGAIFGWFVPVCGKGSDPRLQRTRLLTRETLGEHV